MITFDNVSKQYDNNQIAVKALNVEIKKGEFFVIIGPSGCGKTTLLKMINRLIPLTAGTIWINDKRISDYNIHESRLEYWLCTTANRPISAYDNRGKYCGCTRTEEME